MDGDLLLVELQSWLCQSGMLAICSMTAQQAHHKMQFVTLKRPTAAMIAAMAVVKWLNERALTFYGCHFTVTFTRQNKKKEFKM